MLTAKTTFLEWARSNALFIGIGIGLRFILWFIISEEYPDSGEYYYYWTFIRHHSHSNEALFECALALENQWPVSYDVCDPSLHYLVILLLVKLIRVLKPIGVIIFCSAVQLITAYMISSLALNRQESNEIVAMYWLNPFIIALTKISMLGLLFHFVLLCLLVSMRHRKSTTFTAIIALLICWDFKFVSLLPLFFLSYLNMSGVSSLFFSICVCIICLYHSKISVPSEMTLYISDAQAYHPSIGVLWYLNGQVFSTFRAYCDRILSLQPLLYGFPLAIRMRKYPDVVVLVLVAIVLLFRKETSAPDVLLVFSIFTKAYPDICRNTKYKTAIILCLFCPLLVSPMLLRLWVSVGTGNANFLFFQGLIMSLSCCIGISGFLNAFLVHRPPAEIEACPT